jgi:hypothetical protein
MKSKLPATVPSGVNTSITSCELITNALMGTVKMVFEALSGTLAVAVAIWVSEPG